MNADRREALLILVDRLCDSAEQYEASAKAGAAQLPFRSRWAVLAAAGIYGDIARQVRVSQGGSLAQRIYTTKTTKAGWVAKALWQAMFKSPYVDRSSLWSRNSLANRNEAIGDSAQRAVAR